MAVLDCISRCVRSKRYFEKENSVRFKDREEVNDGSGGVLALHWLSFYLINT